MSVASLTGSYAIDEIGQRLLARPVSHRATLHTVVCATGRGLRALGLFYSQFRDFGRLLPLEAEIGRALCGRSARSFLQSSRGSERLWHDI
ncbi:hypothetical protein SAMN04488032_1391 [Pacificibacter marinus]|uniref:Uncharacterized protein n=1 Tax=Pacificibacter marinus TaxID=658057 RepID=A0A1Y5TZB9_9RHOB|nr:hypothetical protein SAMN04488032_1391 [Pacificibacter marinus]SLN71967.1 hypothetical protein PAM7971_03855 [Pacificibacter marinus]